MRKESTITRNTLRFINKLRRENGCDPLDDILPGQKAHGVTCPIAASLRDCPKLGATRVGVSKVWLNGNGYELETPVNMPKAAVEFVKRFDTGRLNEYDKDAIDNELLRDYLNNGGGYE